MGIGRMKGRNKGGAIKGEGIRLERIGFSRRGMDRDGEQGEKKKLLFRELLGDLQKTGIGEIPRSTMMTPVKTLSNRGVGV